MIPMFPSVSHRPRLTSGQSEVALRDEGAVGSGMSRTAMTISGEMECEVIEVGRWEWPSISASSLLSSYDGFFKSQSQTRE